MNNKLLVFINKKKTLIMIFAVILCLLLCVSCRLNIPVKEMAQARLLITRAVEVKSEKYAPEELKKAKDELYKSHDSMKAEDIKAAKKAAEDSMKYSSDAIEKALPLLANDTLSEAKQTYEEAELAFAEKYAAEEYALAGTKIGEAELLLTDQKYWESYLKSGEAINDASNARDKALSNISALQENIDRISKSAKELESIGGREFAPNEIKEIELNLEEAAQLLVKKNIKEASAKVADADAALKIAYQKTWREVASAKIKAAEDAMKNLEKSPYKDSFADDMTKAGTLIKESRELFEREAYYESSAKSEEALTLLNSIAIAQEKKSEEKRIADEGKEEGKIELTLTGETTEYIVKYNPNNRDCLWRIAMFSYKDARLWPLIYIANKNQIKDPDLIFPGQKLKIPSVQGKTEKHKIEIESNDKTDQTGEKPDIDKSKTDETGGLKEKASEGTAEKPGETNMNKEENMEKKEEVIERKNGGSGDLNEETTDDENDKEEEPDLNEGTPEGNSVEDT